MNDIRTGKCPEDFIQEKKRMNFFYERNISLQCGDGHDPDAMCGESFFEKTSFPTRDGHVKVFFRQGGCRANHVALCPPPSTLLYDIKKGRWGGALRYV